jgi:hypothetical protein
MVPCSGEAAEFPGDARGRGAGPFGVGAAVGLNAV